MSFKIAQNKNKQLKMNWNKIERKKKASYYNEKDEEYSEPS